MKLRKQASSVLFQTISYLPHFLSWVIVTGIVATSLSTQDGIVNIVLAEASSYSESLFFG